jgi:hypothetical protein
MTVLERRIKDDPEFAERLRFNAYLILERAAWRWDREWIIIGDSSGTAQFMRYPS